MKQLILLTGLFCCHATFAQKSGLVIIQPAKDSIIMPNVLKGQNLGLNYQYNNGQGFDIYESGFDRMPVLMPDKNNLASLGSNKPQSQPSYKPYRKFQLEPALPKDPFGIKLEQDSIILSPKKFNKN